MKLTKPQILLAKHLRELGLKPTFEHRFCDTRKWRFDIALLDAPHLGIEIDGGAWSGGRHTRGKGFIADMEKQNWAAMLGWRILRFTPQQVMDGTAIEFIKQFLREPDRKPGVDDEL